MNYPGWFYVDVIGNILNEIFLHTAEVSLLLLCFPIFDSKVTLNSAQLLILLFGTLFDLLSNLNKQTNLYLRGDGETIEKMIQISWFKSALNM